MSTIRKKPKLEEEIVVAEEDETIKEEQEDALLALIEHRTKEVETLRKQVALYQSERRGWKTHNVNLLAFESNRSRM